jgi:hypothetical protein
MKKNQGVDEMGETYEQRFLVGLQTLKNLGETREIAKTLTAVARRGGAE